MWFTHYGVASKMTNTKSDSARASKSPHNSRPYGYSCQYHIADTSIFDDSHPAYLRKLGVSGRATRKIKQYEYINMVSLTITGMK